MMNGLESAAARRTEGAGEVDPVELEVIRQRLVAIPNLIEKNIERTAFSLLIQEYKDYAVGFVDCDGLLVTQSRYSLPSFVANALGLGVREGLRVYGADDLHTGDLVIVNGYILGKHLNDVVAFTPIRAGGRLIGFFAVIVHWIDLGGLVVGSCFAPNSTDVWQEGTQYPTVKLIARGARNTDMFRLVAANSRFPELLLGDLEAQIGGCTLGHDMVQDVMAQHGVTEVQAAMAAMRTDAEAAAARAVAALAPGTYTASSFLDDDGLRRGEPIPIEVKVTVADGTVTVDLSGIGDQVPGPSNLAREGGAVAVSRLAFKLLFVPDTPVNEGDFAPLRVEIPEGKFLSAGPEAAIGCGSYVQPTVVDTILAALAAALPDRVPAAHHGVYGIHTLTGHHPESGERFFCLDAMSGGWGACAGDDGPSALRSVSHGDVRDVPVEIQEALFPYRITAKRLRCDSGGAGRRRGGLGVEKIYHFPRDAGLMLNINIDRTGCPPWGLAGGGPGAVPEVEMLHPDGRREGLTKDNRRLDPGCSVRVSSAGGGGHGPGHEREIPRVLEDLRLGYLSRDGAARDYGVVVDEAGQLDPAATRQMRQRLAARGD